LVGRHGKVALFEAVGARDPATGQVSDCKAKPHSVPYALIIVSSILNLFTAFTACDSFAGMMMASPILK
jgi:hypothetical protein